MTPTTVERPQVFKVYTTTLAILNILLLLAAVLLVVGTIVIFCASYLFNDSGNVPQTTAPARYLMLLDAFIALILFIWQFRTRKHLFAMLPSARVSMLGLGIAYVVVAIINLWQIWIFSIPMAAIGIWWIVIFSRSSTRAAFENPQPVSEILPPAS